MEKTEKTGLTTLSFQTYKFRAEAWRDAAEILKAITELDLHGDLHKYLVIPDDDGYRTPELTVTIVTSLDPRYLTQIMRTIPDCHVAAESLKLAEDFDGVRDNVFGVTWRNPPDLHQQIDRVNRHRETLFNVFKCRIAASVKKLIQVEYHQLYPGIEREFEILEVREAFFRILNTKTDLATSIEFRKAEDWEFADSTAIRYAEAAGERVKTITITFL